MMENNANLNEIGECVHESSSFYSREIANKIEAMAESSASDADGDDKVLSLQQVWTVRLHKVIWIPDTQSTEGITYFKITKWDRALTKLVTGKSLQLHSKSDKRNINVKLFQEWASLRQCACDAALRKVIEDGHVQEGSEVPKKIRHAREEDAYLVGRSVIIQTPEFTAADGTVYPGKPIRVLWQIKGVDIWIELNLENVKHTLEAIRASPPEPPKQAKGKASPGRRRRRLKRRHSDSAEPAVAQDEDAEQDKLGSGCETYAQFILFECHIVV